MPVYAYECVKCEAVTDKFFNVEDFPQSVECEECGGLAEKNLAHDQKGFRQTTCWEKPLKSTAAGVLPDQIPEAERQLEMAGVDSRGAFDAQGRMVFYSRGDRKQKLKAVGLHDNNGGYGD